MWTRYMCTIRYHDTNVTKQLKSVFCKETTKTQKYSLIGCPNSPFYNI